MPRTPVHTCAAFALAAFVTVVAAVLGPVEPAPAAGRVATAQMPDNPLAAAPFYVDPSTWAGWSVTNNPATAASSRVIAATPQAAWIGDWVPTQQVRAQVDGYVGAASRVGQLPVLVLYAIPHRDCGGFSAGGLGDRGAYDAWVSEVVRGIAGRPAAVIVEPDALSSLDCLSAADQSDRYAMLKGAVARLTASSKTTVYLDAGHSEWLSVQEAARRLKAAGVDRARGFSLNVSNFLLTRDEVAYGEAVSALVDGKHYVVDTSRNGRGPAARAPLNWCNPDGRGLGSKPTTRTAGAHADAYLWVKHPGESDGECDRGDPHSGTWFDAYAVGLVQRASSS